MLNLQLDYAPAALKIIPLLCLSESQSELIRDPVNVWFILRAADLRFLPTVASRPCLLREAISCCTLIHSGLWGCCIVSTNYLFSGWILSPLSACCNHTPPPPPPRWKWWKLAGSATFRPPELRRPRRGENTLCLSGYARFHLDTSNQFDPNVFASDAAIRDRGAK